MNTILPSLHFRFRLRNLLSLFFVLGFQSIWAQSVLTLEEAINTALKNSFEIKIAKNQAEIAKISNSTGFAGGLPSVSAAAGANEGINQFSQALSNGTTTERSGVIINNQNANITGSYTIFNGFYVVANKKRLAELEKQNNSLLQTQIQNTISSVSAKYYDLVRQQNYLKTSLKSIAVSEKKLQLVETKKNIGLANDADYFQAQLDLNLSKQDLSSQKLLLRQAKIDLQQLIAQNADTNFQVVDTIVFGKPLVLDSILQFIQSNPQLASAENLVRINELSEKQIAAQRYPSLRLNAGFNYNRTQSSAGLQLFNQTYGPTIGVNLAIPIYNGGIYSTQQQVQQISTLNAKLQKESLSMNFYNTATKVFEAYKTNLSLLENERKNYELSFKLLDLIIKRFNANQATIIDVRTAQKSYEDAGYRVINIAYLCKLAEIELNRLSSKLNY